MQGKYDRIPQSDRERIAELFNRASVEAVQRHDPPHIVMTLREEYLKERARLGLSGALAGGKRC